jgi:hypothetical protein
MRTEDTFPHWICRFIFFHRKEHPQDLCLQQAISPDVGPALQSAERRRNILPRNARR